MADVLLLKKCGGQPDPLAPAGNFRPQKQGAQVLFDGARADPEFAGDIFVAAALCQQIEHLPVAAGDFDLVEA
jgi:hypothetical protein